MKRFRVLTTGGGTAGHIYPIVAVVAELQTMASEQQVSLEVRYLGAYGSFKGFLQENNIRVQRVANSKLRRHFNWRAGGGWLFFKPKFEPAWN